MTDFVYTLRALPQRGRRRLSKPCGPFCAKQFGLSEDNGGPGGVLYGVTSYGNGTIFELTP